MRARGILTFLSNDFKVKPDSCAMKVKFFLVKNEVGLFVSFFGGHAPSTDLELILNIIGTGLSVSTAVRTRKMVNYA